MKCVLDYVNFNQACIGKFLLQETFHFRVKPAIRLFVRKYMVFSCGLYLYADIVGGEF